MTKKNDKSPLWAITTFYDSTGNLWRLRNLRAFYHHLNVPLLVVELVGSGGGQLESTDADMIVTLMGDSLIWQKERLLNIGIRHLPADVEYVAWIDSDIVFENRAWADDAITLLKSGKQYVQLFESVARLPELPETSLLDMESLLNTKPVLEKPSFAYAVDKDEYFRLDQGDLLAKEHAKARRGHTYGIVHGIGWASKRQTHEQICLYDACIIGGGPSAMALAMIGSPEQLTAKRPMSTRHNAHYLDWARAFNGNSRSSIGCVSGRAVHLWHGAYENRGYHERHFVLKEMNFDPETDLTKVDNATWEWSPGAAELRAAVKSYFYKR